MLWCIELAGSMPYYGAKPDSPDGSDYKANYSSIPAFPSEVDLRNYVVEIYDQGTLSSCTANALCAAYRMDLRKRGYQDFNPSRLFLYYNTPKHRGRASIRDTIKAMKRIGMCSESDWPYHTQNFDEMPSRDCYNAARSNTLSRYKYQRLDQDIDQFRACLKDKCPFVFWFKVYNSLHNASNRQRGDMPMPEQGEALVGRHAVVAVGYSDGARRVIVLNSWGSRWGDRGYLYMPYDFITNAGMCFDFWKISQEDMSHMPHPDITISSNGSGGCHVSCDYPSTSSASGSICSPSSSSAYPPLTGLVSSFLSSSPLLLFLIPVISLFVFLLWGRRARGEE